MFLEPGGPWEETAEQDRLVSLSVTFSRIKAGATGGVSRPSCVLCSERLGEKAELDQVTDAAVSSNHSGGMQTPLWL